MEVESRSENRIKLRGLTDGVDIRLTSDNQRKEWLLGGYDREVPRRTEESTARLRDLWGDRALSSRRGEDDNSTNGSASIERDMSAYAKAMSSGAARAKGMIGQVNWKGERNEPAAC
ncbi:hypothetical protein [Paracoccus ravus]|uniref:hypothetical protein n=1 Tax=Paracoccus ravus TaxID=2447760 RepID=UPI00106E4A69|nr:hypothetical protein [Paracoccus ravus]